MRVISENIFLGQHLLVKEDIYPVIIIQEGHDAGP